VLDTRRVLQQSTHQVLVAYYRLSERVADFFNLSRRLSLLALLIALGLSYLLALAIFHEAWIGVGLIMVVFVVLPVLAVRIDWLIISVMLAVASLISPVFWDTLALAEEGITLPNIMILLGLLMLVLRAAAGYTSPRALWLNPTTLAVMFFLSMVAIAFVYHVMVLRLPYRKELAELLHLMMWMLYFLTLGVLRDRRVLRTLQFGLLGVAFIGAVPTALQSIFGEEALFFIKLTHKDIRLEQAEGLLRVIPPGDNLLLVAFLVCAQMVALSRGGKRLGWLLLLGVYTTAILMTLTRHTWFAALLGLGIFWLFADTRTKVNTAIVSIIIAFVAASVVLLTRPVKVHTPDDFFAKIGRRFISTFYEDPQQYSLSRVTSMGQRTNEMRFVLSKLPESPWFGYGWSVRQPVKIAYTPYVGTTYQPTTYIHNSFWWIVGKGGIVGTAGLLVLWLTGIWRGYRLYRAATDPHTKAWLLALWVSFLCLILAAQFEPVFWIRNRIVAPAMVLALMEGIHYFSTRNVRDVQTAQAQTH